MQQPQILEFMCLPNFAMSGSSSCTTRLSIGGRPACHIQDVSMLLQVKNLHTRKGVAAPIPCFSAQFAVATRDASRCGADEFAQILIFGWEVFMCCDFSVYALIQFSGVANNHLMISSGWYDMQNLHAFAAQYCKFQFGNRLLSVNWWSQVNLAPLALLDNFVHMQRRSFKGSKKHQLCSHTTNGIHGQKRTYYCQYACKAINSGNAIEVPDRFPMSSKGTMFYLPDDHFVEDTVLLPFGLCHQRWTTISLLLIPRFNGKDPLRLSSVMVIQNLQLSPPKPRVHTPDRPPGEPPAGHQLVWSTMEALEDCRCSNIEPGLSTDERSLFGFIGNLRYQLQVFGSYFFLVRLGTFYPCSTLCCRDMLYSEL